MDFAQREDKECQRMLEIFAEWLPEILANDGARCQPGKAEELSGLKCDDVDGIHTYESWIG
jgi:hypothetical protein